MDKIRSRIKTAHTTHDLDKAHGRSPIKSSHLSEAEADANRNQRTESSKEREGQLK